MGGSWVVLGKLIVDTSEHTMVYHMVMKHHSHAINNAQELLAKTTLIAFFGASLS